MKTPSPVYTLTTLSLSLRGGISRPVYRYINTEYFKSTSTGTYHIYHPLLHVQHYVHWSSNYLSSRKSLIDGWMDGWMDGWVDDGWMDG